jgi:mycothiol synthase
MKGTIRPFSDSDYAGVVAVFTAVNPDHPSSVKDMRYWDENREARIVWGRFVYEEEGEILGTANYSLMSWMFHPRKYAGSVMVHPEHRRRGIGAALYDTILAAVEEHGAISLRGEAREDRPEGIRFLEQRGFVAGMIEQESAVDLTRFEPEKFAEALTRLEGTGIRILCYEDLGDDPERHRKLYVMEGIAEKDMPAPEPLTQPSFENYCKKVFENHKFIPATYFVAVEGDDYVGLSNLWSRNVPGSLDTGFTGVLREYRGRGLATALKVAVLSRAKELGYKEALTWNDKTNAGMLGINWRLGFEKRPAWIDYEKIIRAESEAGPDSEVES